MKREDITGIFPDATQEQINSLMSINGNDINTAKGNLANVQQQLTDATATINQLRASAGDLAAEQQKVTNLQTELDGLKAANAVRDVREKVATETGVPASLLTGTTEEECKTQAQGILEFSKPGKYPSVKDAG